MHGGSCVLCPPFHARALLSYYIIGVLNGVSFLYVQTVNIIFVAVRNLKSNFLRDEMFRPNKRQHPVALLALQSNANAHIPHPFHSRSRDIFALANSARPLFIAIFLELLIVFRGVIIILHSIHRTISFSKFYSLK